MNYCAEMTVLEKPQRTSQFDWNHVLPEISIIKLSHEGGSIPSPTNCECKNIHIDSTKLLKRILCKTEIFHLITHQ